MTIDAVKDWQKVRYEQIKEEWSQHAALFYSTAGLNLPRNVGAFAQLDSYPRFRVELNNC